MSSGKSTQPRADLGEGALSGRPHHLARWEEGCSACRGKFTLQSELCPLKSEKKILFIYLFNNQDKTLTTSCISCRLRNIYLLKYGDVY